MWKSTTIIPERRVPIIMKGDSGYIDPNGVRYIAGYYDAEYRPHQPWRDYSNDSVLDGGEMPTHWMYITELEEIISGRKSSPEATRQQNRNS